MPAQRDFFPSGFFALRTPLLPVDELLGWSADLQAPTALAEPAALAGVLAGDRARLRSRLQEILARPAVRDAIFVASPDLDDSLARWQAEPDSEKGQKTERALVRYFVRMAARSTPFGLFAGCSVGTLGEQTAFVLPAQSAYQRHTRLDMDYLFAFSESLVRDPLLRQTLVYHPNTCLYCAGARLRYAEARLNGKLRSYHLVAVDDNPYLAATLARARHGADPPTLAAALVADDPDIVLEEAEQFIDDLIASQLLVAHLTLAVTGDEPIHDILAQLSSYSASAAASESQLKQMTQQLQQTHTALAALDASGLGVSADAYRAIAHQLTALPIKVELARLFQVDMVKPVVTATLSSSIIDELSRGVELLHRLNNPRQDGLNKFREAFQARYEGRAAPLVEALDEEIGIGFDQAGGQGGEASPLLAGLAFTVQPGEPITAWGARQTLLLRKLEEAQRSGAQAIELNQSDLAAFSAQPALPLPAAFGVMANLAAVSEAALAQGDFQLYLHGMHGPSGARLLGRFCHADPALQAQVEIHLRAEEALDPDALFAEVVHLPEGRIGNILCRPVLRGYEIPFLGRSSATPEQQIPITDLMVSVENSQIILRSARLNRRVIPRLTSAHNYNLRGLGIYKFLCALQHQGVVGGLAWDWGALESAAFLPRVTSGRLVLARARWLVSSEEIKRLADSRDAARFQTVQQWRAQRALPRLLLVADGDNELPVDLDNILSIDSFVDLVKGRSGATLVEFFPSPDQLFTRGPEGRFTHEIIVPFVRTREEKGTRRQEDKGSERVEVTPSPFHPFTPSPRSFPPGSEWLYAKLYTGAATADRVLRQVVAPVVAGSTQGGASAPWFFIRYGDPHWHVRVRVQGEPVWLMTNLLPALHQAAAPLLESGQLWRIQLDTYEREVERYGGPRGMLLSERLFQADSAAVLAIVNLLDGDAGAVARWRLALRGMDLLLTDLGFDAAAKHAVVKRARAGFASEFRADKHFFGQLGEKFRNERQALIGILDPEYDVTHPLAPGFAVLAQRSTWLAPVAAELRAAEQAGQLSTPLPDLALSYLHMHANRLLRSAQRAQELVLYDFLDRLYEARAARLRQTKARASHA
jgi:thiopeptide-type bacteriocin biosynthesis protein